MKTQDDDNRIERIAARLAELERICGVRPDDPEPETVLTVQVLASWVADLSQQVRISGKWLEDLRQEFDRYVAEHDPKERMP